MKFTHFTISVMGSPSCPKPYPWCIPFLHPWLLVNLKSMYSTPCIHEDCLLCKPMLLAQILILTWVSLIILPLVFPWLPPPRLFLFRAEFLPKWKDSLHMVLLAWKAASFHAQLKCPHSHKLLTNLHRKPGGRAGVWVTAVWQTDDCVLPMMLLARVLYESPPLLRFRVITCRCGKWFRVWLTFIH